MSRIHEALQRANANSSTAVADDETTVGRTPARPAAGQEIATLTVEPYPVEESVSAQALLPREPEAQRRVAPPTPAARTSTGRASAERTSPQRASIETETAEEPPRKVNETLFDRIDARLAEKIVVDANMPQSSREQYRRLAAVLHDAQANAGIRAIMIASAVPGEGKTLTAANVALTLSDSYQRRVLLIDADLRKPTLHEVFRLNAATGLIDGLESPDEVKLVLRQVGTHLSVLPAGRPTSDPMAGLTSERMRRLVEEAKETFDWVIIDTPPLMLLPDAHLLSALVDGAVLVVKAGSTPHDMVKRSAEIIGRNRVIGVVLNQADARIQPGYGSGYGGYYATKTGDGKRA